MLALSIRYIFVTKVRSHSVLTPTDVVLRRQERMVLRYRYLLKGAAVVLIVLMLLNNAARVTQNMN